MPEHQAHATRRWHRGAWNPAAVCTCGWQTWARNDGHARELAAAHQATP